MAYIAPGSIIRLIQGCPLNDTYENTILFESASAQQSYFSGLQHIDFLNQSYQRWDKGTLRLEDAPDDLIGYNYMMFQNTPFSSRWYYAFVTDVEYVNNTTATVSYAIDVMQTWHFDYTLHDCYIERQHAEHDAMYENLVPEDLDLGDSYTCVHTDAYDMNDQYICALATCDTAGGDGWEAQTKNGIFSGLNVISGLEVDDPTDVKTLISNLVGDGDEASIVNMFQYPKFIGGAASWYGADTQIITRTLSIGDGEYYPSNNKLFSYPYSYLLVSNNSGQTAVFHWEDFAYRALGNVDFEIRGCYVPTVSVLCFPMNHRGIVADFDSGLTYSDFPQCAWAGNTYAAWYAQNANQARLSIFTSAINNMFTGEMIGANAGQTRYMAQSAGLPVGQVAAGAAAGALAGGAVGAVVGAIGGAALGVASNMAKTADLKNSPDQAHGQTSVSALNTAMSRCAFHFYQMTIKRQFAEIIDDYFTMYGYAQHKVATPNRNARTRWTYVKTIGSDATGPIPKKHLDAINSIFDAGVRFWNNPGDIGNYSLGNPPRS